MLQDWESKNMRSGPDPQRKIGNFQGSVKGQAGGCGCLPGSLFSRIWKSQKETARTTGFGCTKYCSSLVASSYSRYLPASLQGPISKPHAIIFSILTPGHWDVQCRLRVKVADARKCWQMGQQGSGNRGLTLGKSSKYCSIVSVDIHVYMQNKNC